jgi:hypothetical protein
MMQRKANKDSGIKKESSARHGTTSKSHSRRNDHGNYMQSMSMRRYHHSPRKSTRRDHASSGVGINPSVSRVRRHKRRPEGDIL